MQKTNNKHARKVQDVQDPQRAHVMPTCRPVNSPEPPLPCTTPTAHVCVSDRTSLPNYPAHVLPEPRHILQPSLLPLLRVCQHGSRLGRAAAAGPGAAAAASPALAGPPRRRAVAARALLLLLRLLLLRACAAVVYRHGAAGVADHGGGGALGKWGSRREQQGLRQPVQNVLGPRDATPYADVRLWAPYAVQVTQQSSWLSMGPRSDSPICTCNES